MTYLNNLKKLFSKNPRLAAFLEQDINFEECNLLMSMTWWITDLFEIYHDPTTNTYVLFIYGSYDFDFMYFISYTFEDCIKLLNAILDADYGFFRNYEANRWWSFIPDWCYLNPDFIAEETKQGIKNLLQEATGSINIEDLDEEEFEQLIAWEKVLGNLKFN